MGYALTRAVQAAIASAPCSVRALAIAAGVAQSTLFRIKSGERPATVDVATKVVAALDGWSLDCTKAAGRVRRQLR